MAAPLVAGGNPRRNRGACGRMRIFAVPTLWVDSSSTDDSRLRGARPETDVHFASLGRAFQADSSGFSPIEGGLAGGGAVSWRASSRERAHECGGGVWG